jgi:hypothetical protein
MVFEGEERQGTGGVIRDIHYWVGVAKVVWHMVRNTWYVVHFVISLPMKNGWQTGLDWAG